MFFKLKFSIKIFMFSYSNSDINNSNLVSGGTYLSPSTSPHLFLLDFGIQCNSVFVCAALESSSSLWEIYFLRTNTIWPAFGLVCQLLNPKWSGKRLFTLSSSMTPCRLGQWRNLPVAWWKPTSQILQLCSWLSQEHSAVPGLWADLHRQTKTWFYSHRWKWFQLSSSSLPGNGKWETTSASRTWATFVKSHVGWKPYMHLIHLVVQKTVDCDVRQISGLPVSIKSIMYL